jgi:hypothetical protein
VSTVIDADPVATWVRELMAERTTWEGTASDLLRAGVQAQANAAAETNSLRMRWPNNPRALAGQLRRAQTFLHTVGIEIAFGRNGRAGTRIIRMSAKPENPHCETVPPTAATNFRGQHVRRQSQERRLPILQAMPTVLTQIHDLSKAPRRTISAR